MVYLPKLLVNFYSKSRQIISYMDPIRSFIVCESSPKRLWAIAISLQEFGWHWWGGLGGMHCHGANQPTLMALRPCRVTGRQEHFGNHLVVPAGQRWTRWKTPNCEVIF